MNIVKFKNISPQIDPETYVSEGVHIIGDVKIGSGSSIWYGSVIRGDVAPVVIGQNTNIQDGTIIHTSRVDGGTYIGNNVTVGHRALLHACKLCDDSFVGMGAIVMDRAVVESFAIVAAGALVTNGKVVKSRQLWAGVPAKYVRDISDEEVDAIKHSSENYVKLAMEYM